MLDLTPEELLFRGGLGNELESELVGSASQRPQCSLSELFLTDIVVRFLRSSFRGCRAPESYPIQNVREFPSLLSYATRNLLRLVKLCNPCSVRNETILRANDPRLLDPAPEDAGDRGLDHINIVIRRLEWETNTLRAATSRVHGGCWCSVVTRGSL
jgi:hypothetical protein